MEAFGIARPAPRIVFGASSSSSSSSQRCQRCCWAMRRCKVAWKRALHGYSDLFFVFWRWHGWQREHLHVSSLLASFFFPLHFCCLLFVVTLVIPVLRHLRDRRTLIVFELFEERGCTLLGMWGESLRRCLFRRTPITGELLVRIFCGFYIKRPACRTPKRNFFKIADRARVLRGLGSIGSYSFLRRAGEGKLS